MSSKSPPDAFFTLKNSTTIYAFEVLQKLGIAVPETVAMVGFDDFELASTLRPSISVLQQPVEEIGRKATELLFDQLHGSRSAGASGSQITKQLTLKTHLVCRRSCGCSPVD
jgi:LacI family transcriptional regulator